MITLRFLCSAKHILRSFSAMQLRSSRAVISLKPSSSRTEVYPSSPLRKSRTAVLLFGASVYSASSSFRMYSAILFLCREFSGIYRGIVFFPKSSCPSATRQQLFPAPPVPIRQALLIIPLVICSCRIIGVPSFSTGILMDGASSLMWDSSDSLPAYFPTVFS